MEAILEDTVADEDLERFERAYLEQKAIGPVSNKAQFEYAWCLVRTHDKHKLLRGVSLLEDLYHKTADEDAKRDYLFYMAVGQYKLKNYEKALKFVEGILQVQPRNHQAAHLRDHIRNRMKRDGLFGMAIIGGTAIAAVGGLVGLGMALSRK